MPACRAVKKRAVGDKDVPSVLNRLNAKSTKRKATKLGARVLTRCFAPGECYDYMPEGPALPDDEADAGQVLGFRW